MYALLCAHLLARVYAVLPENPKWPVDAGIYTVFLVTIVYGKSGKLILERSMSMTYMST